LGLNLSHISQWFSRSGDFLPVNGALSEQPSHDIVLRRPVRDVEAIDWSGPA
jgi:hypothetical protein